MDLNEHGLLVFTTFLPHVHLLTKYALNIEKKLMAEISMYRYVNYVGKLLSKQTGLYCLERRCLEKIGRFYYKNSSNQEQTQTVKLFLS